MSNYRLNSTLVSGVTTRRDATSLQRASTVVVEQSAIETVTLLAQMGKSPAEVVVTTHSGREIRRELVEGDFLMATLDDVIQLLFDYNLLEEAAELTQVTDNAHYIGKHVTIQDTQEIRGPQHGVIFSIEGDKAVVKKYNGGQYVVKL